MSGKTLFVNDEVYERLVITKNYLKEKGMSNPSFSDAINYLGGWLNVVWEK